MPIAFPRGPYNYIVTEIDRTPDGKFAAKYALRSSGMSLDTESEWIEATFVSASDAIAWFHAMAADNGVSLVQVYKENGTLDLDAMTRENEETFSLLESTMSFLLDRTHSQTALHLAAGIDGILTKRLLSGMAPLSKTLHNRIFKGYGPLSSFSAKIDLSFALGLIDQSLFNELTILRRIRNQFAHPEGALNFESIEIKNLCREFTTYIDTKDGLFNFREAADKIITALRSLPSAKPR